MSKLSKEDVHYQTHPKGKDKCVGCTMFRPAHECTAVRGHIDPRGWCDEFEINGPFGQGR